jgi:hypothetical protein
MGEDVAIIDVQIERQRNSTVPVSLSLPDARDHGVSGQFVFPEGMALATRASQVKLAVTVPRVPLVPKTVYFGLRTIRLQAHSGDITVESTFRVEILPPRRPFVAFPP